MATYKGQDIASPDLLDSIQALLGHPAIVQPNVEEDLGAWPEAAPDYVPRPGQKHYMDQDFAPAPINYFAMAAHR